jgi:hypothetical protein
VRTTHAIRCDPRSPEEAAPVAERDELLEALDHPIFFSIVITLVVVAWMAIFTWGFKALNLPGPAALFQHP